MSKWLDYYKERLIAKEDVGKLVQSNWKIFTAPAVTGTSGEIIKSIIDRANELENVELGESIVMVPHPFLDPKVIEQVYPNIIGFTGFALGSSRELYKPKLRDSLMSQTSDGDIVLGEIIDMFLVSTTPPDKNGWLNLSICNFCHQDAIRYGREKGKTKIVVCETNDQLPVVYGDNWLHVSEIDYFCESSRPMFEIPSSAGLATEDEKSIANYVSSLIKDGDNIQIGIGNIPETVATLLDSKHDLGIVTEVLVGGHLDMIEKGVVTNKKRDFYKGTSLFSFVLGDKRLYDYVTENNAAQIMAGNKIAHPMNIAKIPNFIACNNSLLVDLSGQIVCEGLGHRMVSGIGGQLDFALGSRWSPGGKNLNLIMAASKNSDGSLRSSVVSEFAPGTPIAIPRYYADYVISEYGIADLRYKNVRARTDALIAIAHPDFRGELRKAARVNFFPAFDQEIK